MSIHCKSFRQGFCPFSHSRKHAFFCQPFCGFSFKPWTSPVWFAGGLIPCILGWTKHNYIFSLTCSQVFSSKSMFWGQIHILIVQVTTPGKHISQILGDTHPEIQVLLSLDRLHPNFWWLRDTAWPHRATWYPLRLKSHWLLSIWKCKQVPKPMNCGAGRVVEKGGRESPFGWLTVFDSHIFLFWTPSLPPKYHPVI